MHASRTIPLAFLGMMTISGGIVGYGHHECDESAGMVMTAIHSTPLTSAMTRFPIPSAIAECRSNPTAVPRNIVKFL
jgi:hypothetical protein